MNHTQIQKYLKKKAADGTVYKIAAATFVLFNFVSLYSLLISQAGRKVDLNFLKDVANPRTYSYAIVLSIISAILISSFIFHKIKTKQLKYNDEDLFYNEIDDLLDNDKKGEIEKVTISLDHNGLMIMPYKDVIEIPVSHYDTADQELEGGNKSSIFKEITFTTPSSWSSKNKSIYTKVRCSKEVLDIIKKINGSNIFFFKETDYKKYYNKSNSDNVGYQHDTMYLSNEEIKKPADKIFKFTDLYNISSIKLHYADCSSTKVRLKSKKEQATNMELCEYIDANRPYPLSNIKEPQIAFIPAIAGDRPVFSGTVL